MAAAACWTGSQRCLQGAWSTDETISSSTAAATNDHASTTTYSRTYWVGKHKKYGWMSPIGKLHADGVRVLESHGWSRCPKDVELTPLFSCTTRGAADFPVDASGPGVPLIRQLPQSVTRWLDDKVELFLAMRAAGVQHLRCMPESFLSGTTEQELNALAAQYPDWSSSRWFVKYRSGVKGRSVHPCRNLRAVQDWLAKQQQTPAARKSKAAKHDSDMGASAMPGGDFVVQREVPARLLDKRRFVLRAHAMLVVRHDTFTVSAHSDVICLPYAVEHEAKSENKAVHVSQIGRDHPTPYLLAVRQPELYATVFPQIRTICGYLLSAVAAPLELLPISNVGAKCPATDQVLYSLLGLDLAIEPGTLARTVLLEVNTYPAIGNGTMSTVPHAVYTRLVSDMLRVLKLVPDDGSNGFEDVERVEV